MPYKDPEKHRASQLERGRRYRQRKHDEKFGVGAGNMAGRHGNHARGSANPNWTGGRFITSQGYVAVRVSSDHPHAWGAHPTVKYAYEHILVMEALLGRSLTVDETVHHGPEGKQVNSAANLSVKTRSDHAKHHDAERGRDALGRFPHAGIG